MKNVRVTLMAACSAIALSSSVAFAASDQLVLGRFGSWETRILKNEGGSPQCNAMLSGSDRWLILKYNESGGVFLHIFKQGWRIPTGQKMTVELQVDGEATRRNFPAVGLTSGVGIAGIAGAGLSGIEIKFGPGYVDGVTGEPTLRLWNNLLRTGRTLFVFFQGDEGGWRGDLAGASRALDSFRACMQTINDNAARPTQPYTPEPVRKTQPF